MQGCPVPDSAPSPVVRTRAEAERLDAAAEVLVRGQIEGGAAVGCIVVNVDDGAYEGVVFTIVNQPKVAQRIVDFLSSLGPSTERVVADEPRERTA